jgi:signal transduction histidine kinase
MSTPPPANARAVRHELPGELIHELRTPLTQIIGYSELLVEQAEAAGDHAYLTDLRKVAAAGYRLLALFEENFHAVRPPGVPATAAAPPAATPSEDQGPDATR